MTHTSSSDDSTFDIMQLGRKVDPTPRILDGLLGGALLLIAMRGRTVASALVGAYGIHRLFSAVTGESLVNTVKEVLGSRPIPLRAKKVAKRDLVDQASWESFPASDPPAYSP